MDKTVLQECLEFLSPFGYSLHSSNANKTHCTFINISDETLPHISCWKSAETSGMELRCILPKGFVVMTTNTIMYKHPRVEFFINLLQGYYIKINQ